ncbi:MAG: ABC transporter permease [Acidimicrobiales bacterium]
MLLAAREILRSKLRFSLLSGAVGLLVFLILFQQALLGGLINDFIGAIENQDSPILVFDDQARSNVEGSFVRPDQVAAIGEVDGVAASAPIGQATYTVDAGDEITDAVLFGYTLGGLGAPTSLTEGRLPEGPDEAVASSADADDGFGIGEVVRILGAGGTPGPEVTVVGLGDNLRWSVAPTLFVSYDTYERAQQAVNPAAEVVFASLVAVQPADGVELGDLTDRIDAEVAGVEALTNTEAIDDNPGVQGVNQSFQIILALAFLVVTLVIGFFFLILTVQKTGALTLLRAIGAPTSYLIKNLLVQILLVLGGGAVIGIALTALVVYGAPPGGVTVAIEPATVLQTMVGLVVLSLLGGIASIRRVTRVDPISATTTVGAAR